MAIVRLFVTNLHYEVNESEIREAFLTVGRPTVINIMKDFNTGKPRGFAFVTLDTLNEPHDCWRAKLQGHILRGRSVHIDFALPKEKKPPRT